VRRGLLAGRTLDDPAGELSRPPAQAASIHDSRERVASVFSDKIRVVPLLDDDGRVADVALFDRRARLPVAEPFLGERHLAYVTPVLVDSDPDTWTIDPAAVEAAITPHTRAIVPVHLYGQPADLDPILAAAERHGVAVVEDAAEAHGAEYKGRRVGTFGVMGV